MDDEDDWRRREGRTRGEAGEREREVAALLLVLVRLRRDGPASFEVERSRLAERLFPLVGPAARFSSFRTRFL